MNGQFAEYLTAYPLLRTDDLDEARHRVTEKFCDHKLDKSSRFDALAVRHNHVAGQHVSINYLHYGADVKIDPGLLEDFYLLQAPLSGTALVRHRGRDIVANAQTATLLNPDRETQMQWHGDCRKLMLQIDKKFLGKVAADLLGRPAPGPIRFDPVVDMQTEPGQHIRRILKRAALMAGEGSLLGGLCGAQDMWAETELVATLLNHQSSNISHMLEAADHHALPADIKRAVAYIHDNLSEPIRLTDIAAHTGVNVRTLQKGFQRTFGKSPMQLLREARLDAAHYYLSVKQDAPSVTDAAYQAGFSHLGRFSSAYKSRFGHLPHKETIT
ncbi:AraC family transcriptional regulator [Sulfitobacter sp. M57]|uniref:AraC family transcriptional regulator n=1 Tax=unclassified Sulfitobacter TaxID=196795 RepID=UPI0023E234A3|nr:MULTISPECIES: AraC family transcriptional regulator [unclassified Sulfitobacter]MDF3415866.1 AraC family transcriptional regulator [Sulfitobacter sp. KE5]MDF3423346.1 AraC family transcriptional regulator [Sulfitobacter sp. KE43]MDF3434412.1 AraC family transcriptional regulator [Sulfitobacter sp. KE42]MDF3460052.1 AraC family transcriptional regulator [Sulfitobacter sp. S74]MDF3463950.1 AraC family transcriptional regulator [Sulfitobacter sp. Ks18]